jgi:uncharacterized tellurite resistance protein B-like protein
MLGKIRRFFEANIAGTTSAGVEVDPERAYQLATAALLIEMTRADYDVKGVERTAVTLAVQRAFNLDHAQTEELVELAEAEADGATSLYEFTRLINRHFDRGQKEHVVELLWQVALADGELDKYEEHLVRKIADLIHVPHLAYVRVKHEVMKRLDEQPARDS